MGLAPPRRRGLLLRRRGDFRLKEGGHPLAGCFLGEFSMRVVGLMGSPSLARVVVAFLVCWVGGWTIHAATPREPVTITYLGNAGWQIEAAHKVLLVDPYLSEFGPGPDENDPDPIVVPDQAQIDARIQRADYILITHGHPDHMLDAPYISNKTGAVIIGTGSHANIARAYGVPEERLIVVLGGEDYQFEGFSLRIMPSLHSPLYGKRYNNDPKLNGNTPAGLKAPLHLSAYVEGGSLAYLLRIGGHRIFIPGTMNFIENELQNLRPDIAMIGAGKSRNENYDYAGRIMRGLGNPPIVLPQH